jgi:hypothetical protein
VQEEEQRRRMEMEQFRLEKEALRLASRKQRKNREDNKIEDNHKTNSLKPPAPSPQKYVLVEL